jgi:hypothetical protein
VVAAAIGGVCEERERGGTNKKMVREKGQILGNWRGWVVLTTRMRESTDWKVISGCVECGRVAKWLGVLSSF